MERDPYAPPLAKTDDPQVREAVSRPISVSLLILLLLAFSMLAVFALGQSIVTMITQTERIQSYGPFAFFVASRLVVLGLSMVVVYGLFTGRAWGRWLGIALVLGLATLMLSRPDTTYYAGEAERAGGRFARLVMMPLMFVWWVYAAGFSRKAKRYFSKDGSKQ